MVNLALIVAAVVYSFIGKVDIDNVHYVHYEREDSNIGWQTIEGYTTNECARGLRAGVSECVRRRARSRVCT